MNQKKTLVIGGSTNPDRYANKAIKKLVRYGHDVLAIGLREGQVGDVHIQTGFPDLTDIQTITMYIGPGKQDAYFDYFVSLKPKRIIFNPGTEHTAFADRLTQQGIEVVYHCTLIMLSDGSY